MTEDVTPRELALLKLIDTLAKENTQLHIQNDMIRYNRRFTNRKYKLPKPSVYIPPVKEEFSKSVKRNNK
jgi:hypothetical protein